MDLVERYINEKPGNDKEVHKDQQWVVGQVHEKKSFFAPQLG